jgi:hypothetical protein
MVLRRWDVLAWSLRSQLILGFAGGLTGFVVLSEWRGFPAILASLSGLGVGGLVLVTLRTLVRVRGLFHGGSFYRGS